MQNRIVVILSSPGRLQEYCTMYSQNHSKDATVEREDISYAYLQYVLIYSIKYCSLYIPSAIHMAIDQSVSLGLHCHRVSWQRVYSLDGLYNLCRTRLHELYMVQCTLHCALSGATSEPDFLPFVLSSLVRI